ncbi:MAG: glycosyltransferase [Candidatus Nanohaloarchaea archaeon]|nr:glycosyltransferase [Candidatus Nanohaloarchaea archaeon]
MKIAVIHPNLSFRRGGEYVACEILQALQDGHDVELVTLQEPDVAALNDHFGTAPDSISVRTPPFPRSLFRFTGERFFKMRNGAIKNYARKKSDDYDLLFSAMNEADLGEPGVQRVFFPDAVNEQWFHETGEVTTDLQKGVDSAVYRVYLALVERFFAQEREAVQQNLALCNSQFTKDVYDEVYDGPSEVLNPPVSMEFDDVPSWEEREDAFLMIGGTSEKNPGEVIEIIDAVREEHEVELTLVGSLPKNSEEVRKMIEERDYVRHEGEVPRDELKQLIQSHRYGIHAFPGEHYGMAPAEMVKGGCIVFVPDRGGPVETVGNEDALTFGDEEGAVEKIEAVLAAEEEQERLREHLSEQAFVSPEAFRERIRDAVRDV